MCNSRGKLVKCLLVGCEIISTQTQMVNKLKNQPVYKRLVIRRLFPDNQQFVPQVISIISLLFEHTFYPVYTAPINTTTR